MKHFKIVGPLTTRDFDIDDDEMITFSVIKVNDFEKDPESFAILTLPLQNDTITETK